MVLHSLTQKLRKFALLGSASVALVSGAGAQSAPDSTRLLLDLLIQKGVITKQDAADLEAKVRAATAAAPAAPAPAPIPAPTPVVRYAAAPPPAAPVPAPVATAAKAPLSFRIGNADFSPLGFLDFTAVYRSATNGGDIGSSFGSVPYGNAAAGQLSETRFSAKNSRLGMRIDSTIGDTKVLGYVETDFLGAAPTNINVASNSDTMRMRVYFVDLRAGDWEFLAGQDWSMMTPNRKGLSPIPSDIFYSQDVDTNYQVGLVWGRTPQVRAVYHASDEWTLGFSAENPDQYVGGAETLPSGFTGTFVDNGSNGTATPNVIPDLVAKLAFDTKFGGLPFHADLAGLFRDFKVNTYTTGAAPVNADSSATGLGASFNMIANLAPHFALIENAFTSNGGGRYISTGLGPDFIVNAPNASGAYTLSTVRASAGMAGFEWDASPMSKLFGYYGIASYGRKYQQLANGTYVGYGFPGSANSNNKTVEEYTAGLSQTLWKGAAGGDLKFLFQYSYVTRQPWYVAPGAPGNAHLNMIYADLRYDLP